MNPRRDSPRRSRSWIPLSLGLLGTALISASISVSWAAPVTEVEREVMQLSRTLKPIPNDEWKRIAGDRIAQKYVISRDDTLWDVSKRLFGDPRYWPKIWALNNGRILNPHVIFPGNSINFMPGTGTSLPGVSVETAQNTDTADTVEDEEGLPEQTATDTGQEGQPARSQEWRMLPRQSWENVELQLPPEIDPLGFDSRSRIFKTPPVGFDLPVMVTSEKLKPLGLIFADEKGSDFISLEDLIFIHPESDMQVGQSYSIVDEPQPLESKDKQNKNNDRKGWAYPVVGTVKILQQRGTMIVGIVTSATYPFTRGAHIAPLEPHIPPMDPIPGPNPITGTVLSDQRLTATTIGQHSFVFVDRGSDDGVTSGMIFRVYQHNDTNNGKLITHDNVLIDADIMILQTSPKFSTGLVTSSDSFFTEGKPVTLLTDVSDLLGRPNPNKIRLEKLLSQAIDDLDSLDNGQGLDGNEKRELRQLEKWKENPAPAPSVAPVADVAPPPPESSEAPPTAPVPAQTQSPESDTALPPPPPPESAALPPETPATQQTQDTELPPPPPAENPSVEAPPAQAPSAQTENVPPPPADEPVSSAPPTTGTPENSAASGTSSTDSTTAPSDIPPPPPGGP